MNVLIIVLLAAGIGFNASAQTDPGLMHIPQITDPETVSVHLNFHSAHVKLFGVVPEGADRIAVILCSSETPETQLARKERVGPFWMAVKKFHVKNIPGCYQVATSHPVSAFLSSGAPDDSINKLRYENLRNSWDVEMEGGEPADDDLDVLFHGLIQMKEKQGLYRLDQESIELRKGGLFLSQFDLPAAITAGDYTVDVYAFHGAKLLGIGESTFSVEKAGVVGFLSLMSKEHALLYAILAVGIALAVGFCVSLVFRRRTAH